MEQQHVLNPMDEKKLPGGLNVLTILTFIGSGIGLISAIWTFASIKKSYEEMQKMMNSDEFEKLPAMVRNMYGPDMLEFTRKSVESKFPIMILSVVASLLCIYGAMEMRKLKGSGYWLWLSGELLPFITMLIFTGFLKGMMFYFIILVTAVFIILYSLQRKHLTEK